MVRRIGEAVAVDFDDLFRREVIAITSLASALTGSRETGADIAQEALLRAYRRWDDVCRLERPGAWIRRVAINLSLDARRRSAREARALTRFRPAVEAPSVDPVDDRFWTAVRALPERQRAVVALRYVDDLPVDEIADVLRTRPGTVKADLFRARSTLARTLGADEVTHADDR